MRVCPCIACCLRINALTPLFQLRIPFWLVIVLANRHSHFFSSFVCVGQMSLICARICCHVTIQLHVVVGGSIRKRLCDASPCSVCVGDARRAVCARANPAARTCVMPQLVVENPSAVKPTTVAKPSAALPDAVPVRVATPLERCRCGGWLTFRRAVDAQCVDFIGAVDLVLVVRDCALGLQDAPQFRNYKLQVGRVDQDQSGLSRGPYWRRGVRSSWLVFAIRDLWFSEMCHPWPCCKQESSLGVSTHVQED